MFALILSLPFFLITLVKGFGDYSRLGFRNMSKMERLFFLLSVAPIFLLTISILLNFFALTFLSFL